MEGQGCCALISFRELNAPVSVSDEMRAIEESNGLWIRLHPLQELGKEPVELLRLFNHG